MKLILVALFISLILVLGYSILAIIISSFFLGSPPMVMEPALSWAISWPRSLYSNFAPDALQNATVAIPGLEPLMFFLGNVLIYAVPVYGLLWLFTRRRMASADAQTTNAI